MVGLFVDRILQLHPEELQRHFEEEAPASAKHPSKYALYLVEYSCFRALSVQAQVTDHLSDKDFRRLTFDMMLAWEAPGATDRPVLKVQQIPTPLNHLVKLLLYISNAINIPPFFCIQNYLESLITEMAVCLLSCFKRK